MNAEEIRQIVERQRAYFATGATLPVEERIHSLRKLQASILKHESQINDAVKADLGKSAFESYMCETGIVLSEISYMLRHIRSYAKEKTVYTPLAQFHAHSYKKPSPHGVVLILSPWNYPFQLALDPLVDALAAGNTAVVKPSAYSPHTSAVIGQILAECFPPEYVATVTGGRAENTALLHEHFDYIFFTGSPTVGREVMRCASEHLTPVTLELGGKSPCIVEQSANLKLTARRLVFGKYLNCGQTCVAPDYLLCDASIREPLLQEIRREITRQFGERPLENPDYGKIINEKHFRRLLGLIDPDKVIVGGESEPEKLRIAPTVMDGVTFSDAVMGEEIFGPILPVLTYESLDSAIAQINARPHPLALYIFTGKKSVADKVTSSVGFGGGCINDTIIHLATSEMGFGGFGESGMGSYHGRVGFETFSHTKSIVDKKSWMDLPLRYQPYTAAAEKLVRMFMR
ncbi:MAG: aldehyde dehydrogenase [Lachnospiraceae bacterium]|nr:aldehyde dehydrogenase [Lachnospiraceae bacterium]